MICKFAEIDLHPNLVDNISIELVFEDLIRRFSEAANEMAGDHFTPRGVIRHMVNLLLEPDSRVLPQEGVIVTVPFSTPMVAHERLRLRYPDKPHRVDQARSATGLAKENSVFLTKRPSK